MSNDGQWMDARKLPSVRGWYWIRPTSGLPRPCYLKPNPHYADGSSWIATTATGAYVAYFGAVACGWLWWSKPIGDAPEVEP